MFSIHVCGGMIMNCGVKHYLFHLLDCSSKSLNGYLTILLSAGSAEHFRVHAVDVLRDVNAVFHSFQ